MTALAANSAPRTLRSIDAIRQQPQSSFLSRPPDLVLVFLSRPPSTMPVDKIAKIKEFKELLDGRADARGVRGGEEEDPQRPCRRAPRGDAGGGAAGHDGHAGAPAHGHAPAHDDAPAGRAKHRRAERRAGWRPRAYSQVRRVRALSGQWSVDNEACPGCCPSQVNITAMGDDAFEVRGPTGRFMYTRQGATDNFKPTFLSSVTALMLILNHNEMKLNAAQHGSFLLKRVNPLPTSGGQLQQPGMQQPGMTQMPPMPMAPQPQQMRQGLLQQGYS